tara:strand:- start:2199 stop:3122 length:924 start_codon:yes stop_codon:yes gene_type:complete
MDIKALIKKERPSIKDSSLKAYLISLKKLNNNKEIENLNFLKDSEKVFDIIKNLALSTQRAYLTAVLVVIQAFKKEEFDSVFKIYRERLQELNNEYNEFINKNEKTEKQNKNWVSLKTLNKVRNFYKKDLEEKGIMKKENLSRLQLDLIQRYLVSALYTLQPPIRLDYGNMKIIQNEKEDDGKKNFLLVKGRNKKTFIFNDFKNKKSMGTKKIEVNKKLNSIINIWLNHNKTDNFLLNSKGEAMSENALSKYIKKTFKPSGKDIGLNLLRHIYISEHIDLDAMKKQKELASQMMHSGEQQIDYAKKD